MELNALCNKLIIMHLLSLLLIFLPNVISLPISKIQNVSVSYESKCSTLHKENIKIFVNLFKFSNGTVSEESENAWYHVDSGNKFEVGCISKFPINLKFTGLLDNYLESSSITRYSDSEENADPASFCYEVKVQISLEISARSNRATGKYSCVPLHKDEDAQNTKSIYIFSGGNKYPHLLYAKKSKKLFVPQSSKELVLPCSSSNPSIPTRLFKDNINITHNSEITFKPTEGFTLANFSCNSRHEFICTEGDEDPISAENEVKFDVRCIKDSEEPTNISITSNGEGVYTCIGAKYMSIAKCRNNLECQFLQSCATASENSTSCGVLELHDKTEDEDNPCKNYTQNCRSVILPKDFEGILFCSNKYKTNTVQQEIFKGITGSINDCTGNCSESNKWISFVPIEYENWVNFNDVNQYENLDVECKVSKVHGANGIKLFFEMENGTRKIVDSSEEKIGQTQNSYVLTAKVYFNQTNITRLICRAPKLSSEEWFEASSPNLVVQRFVDVILYKPENETVQFPLNSKPTLECSANGTEIEINWQKNGLVANLKDHNIETHAANNNRFRKSVISVYHDPTAANKYNDSKDVYACIARDEQNHTLTKYFIVEWTQPEEKPNYLVPGIVAAIVFVLCITGTLCIIKYMKKHWLEQAYQQVINEFYKGTKYTQVSIMNTGKKDSNDTIDHGSPEDRNMESETRTSTLMQKWKHFIWCHYKNNQQIIQADPTREDATKDCWNNRYIKQFEIKDADNKLTQRDKIGAGNFGVVYHGTLNQDDGDVDVVIKQLPPNATLEQFKDILFEIKILQLVGEHPNIVKFYGAVTRNTGQFNSPKIVMEYCELMDLKNFLKDLDLNLFKDEVNPPISPHYGPVSNLAQAPTTGQHYVGVEVKIDTTRLFKWSYDIASAMDHLSAIPIVHRDLAARNILLTKNMEVKICDFGLAKDLQKSENSNYYGNERKNVPWRWLSIEALEKRKFAVDSDLWAFGVTLWEIFNLCKFDPYNWIAQPRELLEFLNDKPENRLTQPKYSNDKMYDIILSCWDEDPTERPRFIELKEAIEDAWDIHDD